MRDTLLGVLLCRRVAVAVHTPDSACGMRIPPLNPSTARTCAKLGRAAASLAQQWLMSDATRGSRFCGSASRWLAKPTAPTTCAAHQRVQTQGHLCQLLTMTDLSLF